MDGGGYKVNFGDVLHALEIAALMISLGIGYQKAQETEATVTMHSAQLQRIEKYLSYKDREYWKITKAQQ